MVIKNSIVYWIHFEGHDDPYKQGYIGITTELGKRIVQHKCKRFKKKFKQGALVTILYDNLTVEESLYVEKLYRPEPFIGWNLAEGGNKPPLQGKPKKNSKVILVGKNRTDKQKIAARKHAEFMKGQTYKKGKKTGKPAWNKGLSNERLKEMSSIVRTCPKCNKIGKGSSMLRWHFDNCKFASGV